jgi:hypothetical protein
MCARAPPQAQLAVDGSERTRTRGVSDDDGSNVLRQPVPVECVGAAPRAAGYAVDVTPFDDDDDL